MRWRACLKIAGQGEKETPQPWAQGLVLSSGRRDGIRPGSEGEIPAGRGSGRAGRGAPPPAAALPAAGSQVTAAPWAAPRARRRPAEQPTKAFLRLVKSARTPRHRSFLQLPSPRRKRGRIPASRRGFRPARCAGPRLCRSRGVPAGPGPGCAHPPRRRAGAKPRTQQSRPGSEQNASFPCYRALPESPPFPSQPQPPATGGSQMFLPFFAPQVDNVRVKRDARTPNTRLESQKGNSSSVST